MVTGDPKLVRIPKDYKKITLVQNAIHNPQEPRHYMTITPFDRQVVVARAGFEYARSGNAVLMMEVANVIINGVYYFPRDDVNMDYFEQSEHKTTCPIKGEATYYHVLLPQRENTGDTTVTTEARLENAAWSYEQPLLMAKAINEMIAFDANKLCHIVECADGTGA